MRVYVCARACVCVCFSVLFDQQNARGSVFDYDGTECCSCCSDGGGGGGGRGATAEEEEVVAVNPLRGAKQSVRPVKKPICGWLTLAATVLECFFSVQPAIIV